MEPRKDVKQDSNAVEIRRVEPKPTLRIVRLEERIAPKLAVNHNESLVREPAKAVAKSKLQIVRLEVRIAPKLAVNHNETLVRDRG